MPDSDVREVLTWEMFGNASRELAQQVFDSGFQPDLILSIARGGLFAAGAVSYALGTSDLHRSLPPLNVCRARDCSALW